MQVKDVMTTSPCWVAPEASVQEVAQKMKLHNCGAIMVGENDKLTGFITDRDIVLRCVAEGKDTSSCKVSEIMTSKILYCYDDWDVDQTVENMNENDILRLVVVNRDKRLVGVVSHSDVADKANGNETVSKVAALACKAA